MAKSWPPKSFPAYRFLHIGWTHSLFCVIHCSLQLKQRVSPISLHQLSWFGASPKKTRCLLKFYLRMRFENATGWMISCKSPRPIETFPWPTAPLRPSHDPLSHWDLPMTHCPIETFPWPTNCEKRFVISRPVYPSRLRKQYTPLLRLVLQASRKEIWKHSKRLL